MNINNKLKLDFLGHSGFIITLQNGKSIAIDPYNIPNNLPKVEFMLITHSHYDHCSIKDISKLVKKKTLILIPANAQSKIARIKDIDMQIIEVGNEIQIGSIRFEATFAYNLNKKFHPKSEGWLGYIIKYENIIIYHAGDTDAIPEMKKLTGYGKIGNIFIALLPVSGTYVMDAEEAAGIAAVIKPAIAVPMHYGAGVAGTLSDAEKFVSLCKTKGIQAEILEKI